MEDNQFHHIQSAHCENGVTASLLIHNGLEFMTEPLAFGMGSGIFYIHLPFIKINKGPALNYRSLPGIIFKRTCRSLGVEIVKRKFRTEIEAQQFLDKKISEGVLVGCQVGVFHLPYFPDQYRFHFNAHNILVYGKENGNYLVSDPVMEETSILSPEELSKVRFAKGPLAPKGHLYFPVNVKPVDDETIRRAIVKGIKRSIREMTSIPSQYIGTNGIKYTASQVRKWRDKLGPKRAGLYLAQIVRMQEEIGTGGGGFRFLYAAFLEQANEYLQKDQILSISEEFTKAGDLWRSSAVEMAGIYKGRLTEQKDYDNCADILVEISNIEKEAFRRLKQLNLN